MREPWRVAQIAVSRGLSGDSSRGSGYLVAPGRVLTAAHVVADARSIRVLLDVGQDGEIDVAADDWWADPKSDLAVVIIPEVHRKCQPAPFGRISDTAAVLPVQACGFPLFKLRDRFRDFEDVSGHAPVAANRRQGTLPVYLDDPAPDPGTGASPWEGMSGAAVWATDRIVAVVAEHHRMEGPGRLTARRYDRVYQLLGPRDLHLLTDLLGLPGSVGELVDVVPAPRGQLVRAAYLTQVRDIAPDELVGRASELAEWAEFCAGTEPYAWWQAGPWAGKTALASWFVTHPPIGVDVVSFFITSRLIGQAGSRAFIDAMIEQLSLLAPDAGADAVMARVGAWLSLLEAAAVRSAERGRVLAVVVDGLDEDEAGAMPGRGRVSIASLLPRRPPRGARFIVTSRPDPGLPDDVPAGHPLRACQPVTLPQSWTAREAESLAKRELRDLLSGDQAGIDTIGYIAGSGGGLTRTDLAELTGMPSGRLDGVLRGVLGRSLHARAAADTRDSESADQVYLFGHETLRVTAEELLGRDLARYRQKVHDWIESYARDGWPDTTPGYAIHGYPRLLASTDFAALSVLVRDRRWHEFLLRATGSDHAALTEIKSAQQLIAASSDPDPRVSVELTARWYILSQRNEFIPERLAAAWAALGRFKHAEALARSLPDRFTRTRALIGVVFKVAEARDYDRAVAIASTLPEEDRRGKSLSDVASVATWAGEHDRAMAIVNGVAAANDRAVVLARLAGENAEAGDYDRAAALARAIPVPDVQMASLTETAELAIEAGETGLALDLIAEAEPVTSLTRYSTEQAAALAELAKLAADARDQDRSRQLAARAEGIARKLADPYWQAETLAAVAVPAIKTGDHQRARELISDAEAAARAVSEPNLSAQALGSVVATITEAGEFDRAEAIAAGISNSHLQTVAVTKLASAIAGAGRFDHAQALARLVAHPYKVLVGVAAAVAEAGDWDRAETVARTITDLADQTRALSHLVRELAAAERFDRAVEIARSVALPNQQAEILAVVAGSIAAAGELDRAEELARSITYITAQLDALISVTIARAAGGDRDRARELALEVDTTARSLISPYGRDMAREEIVLAMLNAGDLDRAESTAYSIGDVLLRALSLARVAAKAADAGEQDRARELAEHAETDAEDIPSLDTFTQRLTELAVILARFGAVEAAERIARGTGEADSLSQVAAATASVGDRSRAIDLAAEAETAARSITYTTGIVAGLTSVAGVFTRAGERRRAIELTAEAEAIARGEADSSYQSQALRKVAAAFAEAGEHDRALNIACEITEPYWRVHTLADLTSQAGDRDQILRVVDEIDMKGLRPGTEIGFIARMMIVLTDAGVHDLAAESAAGIEEYVAGLGDVQGRMLAELAVAVERVGDHPLAMRFLTRALAMDVSGLWWLETVSKSFPDLLGDTLDVLVV